MKMLRCLRSKELGKKHYFRADVLLAEIATEIEPGQSLKVGDRKITLEDKYAGKTIVWTPCAARRYDLKVEPV